MNRLSLYLVRLFTRQTLALLGVMLGLLFLIQCLKIFDVVSVQGQDLWTLVGQAVLSMPTLAIIIAYVCMGIGLVRGLGALQASQELHIIHANRQLRSLVSAIAIFAVGGALVVLFAANFVEPWANRRLDDWSARIAADIVGRTLTPHRFTQVVPGVTIEIGGREGSGNISQFFADDARDDKIRRTYIAKTAKIATDQDGGYVLELHDGSLQYLSADKDFSQISFRTYNIGLEKLTQTAGSRDAFSESTSWDVVQAAFADGGLTHEMRTLLFDRLAQGLRAVAMCVFVGALAMFPHARRGRNWMPLELAPIVIAYFGTSLNSIVGGAPAAQAFTGPLAILLVGLAVVLWRLHLLRRPRPIPRPA